MKKYTTPDLEILTISNSDILTESTAVENPGLEGPVVDVETSEWNW